MTYNSPTPDQRRIIDHVARHRLTTPAALSTCFPSISLNAVGKKLGRLTDGGYLERRDLFETNTRHYYWTLRPDAARELGVNGFDFASHGVQAVARDYAMLHFCTLSPGARYRRRLTPTEVADLWPGLRGVDRYTFYESFDPKTDDAPRYGFLKVVHRAHPVRALNRARKTVDALLAYPALGQLLLAGRFAVCFAAGYEQKKARLDDELDLRRSRRELIGRYFVVTIRELRFIIR